MIAAVSYYLTTPIYYVNSTPHVGHADHRDRHPRPPPAPSGEDLLSDGHRRARLEDRPRRRGKGPRAPCLRGCDGGSLARASRAGERDERLLHPHDGSRARTRGPGVPAGDLRPRRDLRGHVRGLYCFSCEAFYSEAELVDGRCPQHGTVPEYVEEKNYFFRLSAYADRLLALYDERPDFVLPVFAPTRRGASSSKGFRTSASAVRRSVGACRSRGTTARSSTCGWTRSSITSARSPTRGRARIYVRASGPRGTCSPRTFSSSIASSGRRSSWPPATTCRAVSSSGYLGRDDPEDVEVDRQRRRPRADRRIRRRRVALPLPRRVVRPGRHHLRRGLHER